MKNLIATFLIVASAGLFYVYVGPTYDEIGVLRAEKAEYDSALANSQKVQDARNDLLEKYNAFAPTDLRRLEKLLPNYLDNIRLIIEIDSVASRYNMILKNVQVSAPSGPASEATPNTNQALPTETLPYGAADLSFSVSGTYETYRSFIKDLEYSLRIVDITTISFSSAKDDKGFDTYDFKTSLRTYWLVQK